MKALVKISFRLLLCVATNNATSYAMGDHLKKITFLLSIILVGIPLAGEEFILTDERLKTHILTVDQVKRAIKATRNMRKAARHESFRIEFLPLEYRHKSLDEVVNTTKNKQPRHAEFIEKSGLSVLEYHLTYSALVEADSLNRQEPEAEYFRPYVHPENLIFVRKHPSLVKKAAYEIETLGRIGDKYR
jgi:hypothetical protein